MDALVLLQGRRHARPAAQAAVELRRQAAATLGAAALALTALPFQAHAGPDLVLGAEVFEQNCGTWLGGQLPVHCLMGPQNSWRLAVAPCCGEMWRKAGHAGCLPQVTLLLLFLPYAHSTPAAVHLPNCPALTTSPQCAHPPTVPF